MNFFQLDPKSSDYPKSSGYPIDRPVRSPGLNPLDFYLWGHLKSIVYATSIENAEILRNRIEQSFRQIRETPGMMERVTR